MPKLGPVMRARGVKRRVVRLRPVRPSLADRRALQAIANEMVEVVFHYAEQLIEAASADVPMLLTVDGVTIGVLKDAVDDVDRLIQLMVLETQNVMVRLQARIRGWGRRTEQRHRERFTQSILSATSIDWSTQLHPSLADRTVQHYVTWSTSLVRDIGDEARRRLAGAVMEAVRTRKPPRELAREIREFSEMSYRRAKNIAADQTNKLNAALDRARQREAGIDNFTWVHSGKAHPREWHLERDGEVFPWDTDEIDEGDFPGEQPFCGCIAQATIVNEPEDASGEAESSVEE